MLSRSLTLVRKDLLLYRADLAPILIMVVLPLGFLAFMVPVNRALLEVRGYPGATGAEQALPGMMVMFALFLLGIVGDQFYREYGWNTWDRVRLAGDMPEIMIGKTVPALAILLAQLTIVFGAGSLLFGMDIVGPPLAVAVLLAAFAVCLVGVLVAEFALCTTFSQFNALNVVVVTVFSGLGGAFAPIDLLPSWAQAAAPFTPTYWVIEALRSVILDGQGVAYALQMAVPVLLFGAAFAVIAAVRLRAGDVKVPDNVP
jgi:ABC-2 type transport system permease protein